MADNRFRNWATVVYPESAPAGWMEKVGELHVPALISPCHDGDVDRVTGELKKRHYHVLLKLSGKISEMQAREMFESFGGVGCEPVRDFTAYARYLCHLDERDDSGKARYNTGLVQAFGGLDYFAIIETQKDRTDLIAEMERWCEKTNTLSYASLRRYARRERRDWYRFLASTAGAATMGSFLKSLKWERETGTATIPESDRFE